MAVGWRPTRLALAFDVGRHLTWLFSYPMARFLDESRAELLSTLTDPVEDWNDYLGNHLTRFSTWCVTGLSCLALGFGAIAAQRFVPVLVDVFQVGFGVSAVTAFLHGLAALAANRWHRTGRAVPTRGPRVILLRPGNRYLVVVLVLVLGGWSAVTG